MTISRMTTSRMTTSTRLGWTKRTVWGGAFVLAVCASGSALAAEDDDNSVWNFDKSLWNGVMSSFGLKSINDGTVEYRERSPLVVPPQRTLPPPETAAAKAPAWPVDPDAKRKADAVAKRNQPKKIWDMEANGRNLTPSELNPAGTPGNGSSGRSDNPESGNFLPSQLGYFGGLFSWSGFGFGGPKEEIGTFTAEPPRAALTEPPAGYQTPSAAQPYGTTKRIEYGKPTQVEGHG